MDILICFRLSLSYREFLSICVRGPWHIRLILSFIRFIDSAFFFFRSFTQLLFILVREKALTMILTQLYLFKHIHSLFQTLRQKNFAPSFLSIPIDCTRILRARKHSNDGKSNNEIKMLRVKY